MTQVEGLTRLIDDLRLLGLQENGHLQLQLRQTCLAGEVRSVALAVGPALEQAGLQLAMELDDQPVVCDPVRIRQALDRKSTRLNSSHLVISYAVFCLKKKKITDPSSLYDANKGRQCCEQIANLQKSLGVDCARTIPVMHVCMYGEYITCGVEMFTAAC